MGLIQKTAIQYENRNLIRALNSIDWLAGVLAQGITPAICQAPSQYLYTRHAYITVQQKSHQVHNPLAAAAYNHRGSANPVVHVAESYSRHQQRYQHHLFMRGTA